MKRKEFSRKTKAQAFERAGGHCQGCKAKLKVGEAEYDHIHPAELEGDNGLHNCQVLCRICHKAKTADDIRGIRKADRCRDKLSGAKTRKGRPMAGTKASGWKRRFDGTVERRK